MKQKTYLGLGAVILIVGVIAFFAIRSEQSTIQELAKSQEMPEKHEEQKLEQNTKRTSNRKTQSYTPIPNHFTNTDGPEPGSLTAPKGYYYVADGETGNYYLDSGPEPGSLTAPKGYYYVADGETGNYYLDSGGNPILTRRGEPFVTLSTFTGFLPTREQYQYYLKLTAEYETVKSNGDTTKASEIKAEMNQIETDAQGELPAVSTMLVMHANATEKEKQAASERAKQMTDQLMEQALIEWNKH
jgi:outer membrane murein-binding lipoprotein Lpp